MKFYCSLALAFCILTIQAQDSKTIKGINTHSLELSSALYKKGENLFCSPLSLSTALAMVYAGSDGQTKAEFEKIMHYPGEETFGQMRFIDQRIEYVNKNGNVTLDLANALWNRIPLKKEYEARLKNEFQAEFYPLTNEKPINEWASDKTRGKIPKVLNEGDITPDMAMVLTNAIYFKGSWLYKFDSSLTKEQNFYPSSGKKEKCELMFSETSVFYFENANYQLIELPYEGNEIVMEVYLPSKNSNISKMLKEISSSKDVPKTYEKTKVFLPKFKMETSYDLIPVMKKMGLVSPFTDANFSKMSDAPLVISKLLQKAFLEVKEKGTEAAAVTVVGITLTSALPTPVKEPKVFRADRPFYFNIKDKQNNLILFTGIVETLQ